MSNGVSYVLGFAIEDNRVALILKRRPEWQAGKFNGIGGKIEKGEIPLEAMCREFEEETGYKTKLSDWRSLGILNNQGLEDEWEVFLFFTENVPLDELKTTTDEPVVIKLVRDIHHLECIPNLRWLVPFAQQYSGLDYRVGLKK